MWPTTKNSITNVCKMKFKILRRRKERNLIYTLTPLKSIFPKQNSFISCDFLSNFPLI